MGGDRPGASWVETVADLARTWRGPPRRWCWLDRQPVQVEEEIVVARPLVVVVEITVIANSHVATEAQQAPQ